MPAQNKPPFEEQPQGPALTSTVPWTSRPEPASSPTSTHSDLPPPRAVLFDIGGVVVSSPFAAILAYEHTLQIPPGYINYALSKHAPNGAWHRLERGELPLDAAFFTRFTADLTDPTLWTHWCVRHGMMVNEGILPPVPRIDGERLYWAMMRASATPDRWMPGAIRALQRRGLLVGALSNTSIIPTPPAGAPAGAPPETDVKRLFEVFVSSAHVGLRKPDARIYEYALAELRKRPGYAELQRGEVLFLDDIGENLKAGRAAGFRTLRVWLGKTREAVKELEVLTGVAGLVEEGDAGRGKL